MKKFLVTNLFLLIFVLSIFIPQSNAKAEGTNEETIQEIVPYMNTFDGEGNLIASYVGDEFNKFLVEEKSELPVSQLYSGLINGYRIYEYSATSFNSHIWVKSGNSFKNPAIININPERTFKKLVIEMYNGSSRLVRSQEVGGFLGSTAIPLWSSSLPSGDYTIKLVHAYGGEPGEPEIKLKKDTVWYDKQ